MALNCVLAHRVQELGQTANQELDDQTVAMITALNGSHGGSSASRLSEAEQGAGEAEASHPNFIQRIAGAGSDKASSSSIDSTERRHNVMSVDTAHYKQSCYILLRKQLIEQIQDLEKQEREEKERRRKRKAESEGPKEVSRSVNTLQ